MKKIFLLTMILAGFTVVSHADQVIDDKIIQYDSFPDVTSSGMSQKAFEFKPEFNFDAPATGAQFISSTPRINVNAPAPFFQNFVAGGTITNNADPLVVYDVTGFFNIPVFESNTNGVAPLLQDAFLDATRNIQNTGSGETTRSAISFNSKPSIEAKDGASLKTGVTVGLFRKPAYAAGAGGLAQADNYGVLMSDPLVSGPGTVNIPMQVGLYVENLTKGQENYSVYSFGNNTKFLNEGPMYLKGSQFVKRTTVNDQHYTVTDDDYIIAYTNLTQQRVVILPAPKEGRVLIIKKEVSGTRSIMINGVVDGVVNKTLTASYGSIRLYSDGKCWYSI